MDPATIQRQRANWLAARRGGFQPGTGGGGLGEAFAAGRPGRRTGGGGRRRRARRARLAQGPGGRQLQSAFSVRPGESTKVKQMPPQTLPPQGDQGAFLGDITAVRPGGGPDSGPGGRPFGPGGGPALGGLGGKQGGGGGIQALLDTIRKRRASRNDGDFNAIPGKQIRPAVQPGGGFATMPGISVRPEFLAR